MVVAAVTAACLYLGLVSPAAAAGTRQAGVAAGSWGTAEEVPGLAALNQGGAAQLSSVSCGAVGNCSAGGFYLDGSDAQQVFVVNETGGSWGEAEEIPGTAALNQGGFAEVSSVSCPAAGDCSAGGYYTHADGTVDEHAFVVSQTGGTWGTAETVPGTGTGESRIDALSCASPGNCSAGGFHTDASGSTEQFMVNQVGGTWGTAQEIPGSNGISAVSCAAAGNCSAAGGNTVISEKNGTWGSAQPVPGTTGDLVRLDALSCASAGNCSAGGQYTTSADYTYAFVVSEKNGSWGTAHRVHGLKMPHQHGSGALISSVSCAASGNCSAGGWYISGFTADDTDILQAFTVDETGGSWGTAAEVPGTAALNTGGNAQLNSLSCASAGTCSAGGIYTDSSGHAEGFVVNQADGTWGTAEPVPGLAALNQGGIAVVSSVSCASAAHCSAGGYYTDSSINQQAFVVNQT
jgi:hypothetical protein